MLLAPALPALESVESNCVMLKYSLTCSHWPLSLRRDSTTNFSDIPAHSPHARTARLKTLIPSCRFVKLSAQSMPWPQPTAAQGSASCSFSAFRIWGYKCRSKYSVFLLSLRLSSGKRHGNLLRSAFFSMTHLDLKSSGGKSRASYELLEIGREDNKIRNDHPPDIGGESLPTWTLPPKPLRNVDERALNCVIDILLVLLCLAFFFFIMLGRRADGNILSDHEITLLDAARFVSILCL